MRSKRQLRLRARAFKALKTLTQRRRRFVPASLNADLYSFSRLGYVANYREPRTFNERLVWLLEHTQDERRGRLADKLHAKEYAVQRYPALKVARVLTVADRGSALVLDDLPETCVLKTNNNTRTVKVLQRPIDRREVVATADAWLALDPCRSKPPWERHYGAIRPLVFIEEYLGDDPRSRITDYRVFVFHGRAHLTWRRVVLGDGTRVRLLLDRDWNLLPVGRPSSPGARAKPPDPALVPARPPNYEALLAAAEALADDIPFVRVDFYLVGDDIYFGEMTFVPNAGYVKFPKDFDRELGSYLRLPTNGYGSPAPGGRRR